VWDYIKNNGILVPLQMFILAFIPIPFLYMANIVVTTIALGFFIGIALHLDVYHGVALTIASFPHTFVELFAYCVLAALLFVLISRSMLNHFHCITYICSNFYILFVNCTFI